MGMIMLDEIIERLVGKQAWKLNKQAGGWTVTTELSSALLEKRLGMAPLSNMKPTSSRIKPPRVSPGIAPAIDTSSSDTVTIDALAAVTPLEWRRTVTFLKPNEFMNLSGVSVSKAYCKKECHTLISQVDLTLVFCGMNDPTQVRHFKLNLRDCIIVHDDLDKKLGTVAIKQGGSGNGHNGTRSIISTLNSKDFARIRVGIGRPADSANIVNYVLEKFSYDEVELVNSTVTPLFFKTLAEILAKDAVYE
eukprot:jgi/Hompol1/5163/HPOL_004184-RA